MASSSDDNTVRIWSLVTGDCLGVHPRAAPVQFPDGTSVVFGALQAPPNIRIAFEGPRVNFIRANLVVWSSSPRLLALSDVVFHGLIDAHPKHIALLTQRAI
eukprot:TRINITY_DN5649_c0_g1_i2.p2 TRINITY_DN5649_c0_g1~~TRINITY_DN5649_c0_g1_i2.p2  ORF type:complete len:102 (-),score=6.82 TRINITY_DN5649_c0_g1_i2:23-328(-)